MRILKIIMIFFLDAAGANSFCTSFLLLDRCLCVFLVCWWKTSWNAKMWWKGDVAKMMISIVCIAYDFAAYFRLVFWHFKRRLMRLLELSDAPGLSKYSSPKQILTLNNSKRKVTSKLYIAVTTNERWRQLMDSNPKFIFCQSDTEPMSDQTTDRRSKIQSKKQSAEHQALL